GFAHAENERPDDAGAGSTEAVARVADLGIVGGDHQVSQHGQLGPAGQAEPVQLGDGHLTHVPEVHLDVDNLLHGSPGAHDQPTALLVFRAVVVADGVVVPA